MSKPFTSPTPITIAAGDGIGPEIMQATLAILKEAGAALALEPIPIGKDIYLAGHASGIKPEAWESLRRTKVFLKAPITTPQGGGYKSLNVTIRKTLGLYANVRPTVAYAPFIKTRHPSMDLIIVRENEEDLYAGIEYRQTADVMQCLKLISRPGCEKIIRYAFEYALKHNRKKVTAFVKDNIMKLTDGLFHTVFDEIAKDYPTLEKSSLIVDIGAARLADTPEMFDVIVMPNLYGDILSDVAAQIAGSVGLAGSANIGEHIAMFEAIHGSAPDIAGRNLANPSGLLHGALQMLVHIGQPEIAERIHNAWLATIEDGVHTGDITSKDYTKEKVGTKEFAHAVIKRLGKQPHQLKPVHYTRDQHTASTHHSHDVSHHAAHVPEKSLVGVDVYLDWRGKVPADLAAKISKLAPAQCPLTAITNRGVSVWPQHFPETYCSDHWRCRFVGENGHPISHKDIAELLVRFADIPLDVIKTENLYRFDGKAGYSAAEG